MKKLVLLSLLGLTVASQVECSFGSNLKLFGKNLAKLGVYATGTAVTGGLALVTFLGADQAEAQIKFARLMSIGAGDLGSYHMLSSLLRLKPVIYGVSAAFGLAALYSGFKTLQSLYKTVTFEE